MAEQGSRPFLKMNQYFGTDGIRGAYESEIMNEVFALRFGQAIGQYLKNKCLDKPLVVVASDTRPSSPILKKSVIRGLHNFGVKLIDFGVIPTPALAYGLIKQRADFGIMITASHNPSTDNGIKCFSEQGTKLDIREEIIIEGLLNHAAPSPCMASTGLQSLSLVENYLENITSYFLDLDLSDLCIAVDSANGATSKTTHQILEFLGARVIKIHHGDGVINEDCGSENLASLQDLVRQKKADLGIAHDGDGDRVRFVDSEGRMVDGDQVLGLLAKQAHQDKALKASTFVSTVHSNKGLFSFFSANKINGLTSDVGDRNVYLKMLEANCNWGGESSGHIICTDYLPTGDGLFAALSVLRAMKRQSQCLSTLASEITLWPSLCDSFFVSHKPPFESIPDLLQSISEEEEHLNDEGRVLLRYSGTEPKLRLLVEGKSPEKIKSSFQRLKLAIQKSL